MQEEPSHHSSGAQLAKDIQVEIIYQNRGTKMSCNRCDILAIIAGERRNEASAKVAEFFLKNTRLSYFTLELPGEGGRLAGELIMRRAGREEVISVSDITQLLEGAATILISAPTYYEPSAHHEIAFWEKILPEPEKRLLAGKFGIAIAIGGNHPQEALRSIVNFFNAQEVKLYCAIANNGIEDCFKCNVGSTCYISDALESFDLNSSVVQDIIATAHFEREEIPACCPGKVQLLPTVEDLARRFGENFLSPVNTP